MLLTEDKNINGNRIKSFTAGKITINDTVYTDSLILSPDHLIEHWRPKKIEDLKSSDLEQIAQQNPEVVLIGTGQQTCFLPDSTLVKLIEKNIGFESMTTAAACRTFNLLVAEGRKVIAALIV